MFIIIIILDREHSKVMDLELARDQKGQNVSTLGRNSIRTIVAFYSKLEFFEGLKNYLNVQ